MVSTYENLQFLGVLLISVPQKKVWGIVKKKSPATRYSDLSSVFQKQMSDFFLKKNSIIQTDFAIAKILFSWLRFPSIEWY